MSTGVEDGVHHVLVADGAFITPRVGAGREGRGFWMAQKWRAWGCACSKETRDQRILEFGKLLLRFCLHMPLNSHAAGNNKIKYKKSLGEGALWQK